MNRRKAGIGFGLSTLRFHYRQYFPQLRFLEHPQKDSIVPYDRLMPETMKSRFIAALQKLESDRQVDALVALFSDNAEVGNVIAPEKFHGPEGARSFWSKYRDTFDALQSVFSNEIEAGDRVALEWTTTGSRSTGKQISYEGVSILELENDKIRRFRAYFDSNALGEQLETPQTSATHS